MCPRDFVHVTVLGVPSRVTSGRAGGQSPDPGATPGALVASGEGIPGRQAQCWDRLVTGESSPRTEHPKIGNK